MKELAAYVGWDWGDSEHELCLISADGEEMERLTLRSDGEVIHEWAAEMRRRYDGKLIGVCLETSRGAVINALMHYDHIVLYPINPKAASDFRKSLYPSGKKDDPVDAETLLEYLWKHQDRCRELRPADEKTRELALLSEARKTQDQELRRFVNRLRSNLKTYFPEGLKLAGDLDTIMACDFLERWPELGRVKRARPSTVERFYREHGSRSEQRIRERLAILERATPLTTDPAVLRAGRLKTEALVKVIRSLIETRDLLQKEASELYQVHPEYELINSFPGAGEIYGARLASTMGTDRDRWKSAEDLQLISGTVPVRLQSGGKNGTVIIHRRLKRPVFMHQTFVEWAGHAVNHSPVWRAIYNDAIANGKRHWSALRKVATKLQSVLYRCWKDGVLYDEGHHLRELIKRRSPVAKRLLEIEAA